MSKQPNKAQGVTDQKSAPAKMPGDHLSSAEQRHAQESTLAQIKDELESERLRNEASDRAMAEKLAGSDQKLAQMQETEEARARSHAATVDLVSREMELQAAENPPRAMPRGIDPDSIDMIKAETAKTHKRVVLPAG